MKKQKSDVATTPAATLEDLALRVGRCVRTLQRHAKNPEAPQRLKNGFHNVAAWQRYFADRGRDGLPDSREFRELKARKLLAEIETIEHRTAMLRKQFVRRCAVDERWQFHRERCIAVLLSMLDEFVDTLVGLDAVQIRKASEIFVDAFSARMRAGT